MIFVDKLDDTDFPTFPQFQAMLREHERQLDEAPQLAMREPRAYLTYKPTTEVVASSVRVALPQRFTAPTITFNGSVNSLWAWPDGVTRCSHGVAFELQCHDCRLQSPDQLCHTETPK